MAGSRITLVAAVCLLVGTVGWWRKRDDPRRYFGDALDIMERHSLRRKTIDWPAFRVAALQRVEGAKTRRDTHEALRQTLQALGDHHSFLQSPAISLPGSAGKNLPVHPAFVASGRMFGRIAYVSVPGYRDGTEEQNTHFANTLQRIVAGLEAQGPAGWIVDLREDRGGNMWPMLAGIGPILGEGEVGGFTYGGNTVAWWYRNGTAGSGSYAGARVSDPPLRLSQPRPAVAVLTGPHTASSGEAVAVAFRGRPNTRSFGAGTCGLSTGNARFPLSDGAVIYLATSTYVDRLGRLYGEVIPPDEPVADSPENQVGADPVVAAALQWLTKSTRP